jgi:putative FmdB family regulatory protein
MPIYEYQCKKCGDSFEFLLRGQETPACPKCGATGEDLEKLLSAPVAHSGGSAQSSGGCPLGSGPSCSCCPGAWGDS